MSEYPYAPPSPGVTPAAPPKPAKFIGLAWAGLILGIVGVVGSPVIIFNNLTAIAAAVGFVLGVIALFGTKKIVAGIGVALTVAAVAITVAVQQSAVEELDRITGDLDMSLAGPSGSVGAAPSLPGSDSTGNPTPVEDFAQPEDDLVEPETNERNYIPMNLGDEAWTGPVVGDESAGTSFTIDRIEVDPSCDVHGMPPESGHTVLLHVSVATGSDEMTAMNAAAEVNPFNFVEIGSDGMSHAAQFGTCTDHTKALPMDFGVNQNYSGTVELVVPEASGTLALDPARMTGGPSGWEWTY